MSKYQETKALVRAYFEAMEAATPQTVAGVLRDFTSEDYLWRGVYPFREQQGAQTTADVFWSPLMASLSLVLGLLRLGQSRQCRKRGIQDSVYFACLKIWL